MSEKADAPAEKESKGPAAPARYPLRVDVAKPAVIYQASFAKDKDKNKETTKRSPLKPPSDGLSPGGGMSSTPRERVLGKRRRGGRTEFLVKRAGSSEGVWEGVKSVSAKAVAEFEEKRQSRQQLQNRLANAKPGKGGGSSAAHATAHAAPDPEAEKAPYRILAQRRMEGGQRYLIHWAGQSVTDASWESAKRINNPTLVHDFEQAVRRVRALRVRACDGRRHATDARAGLSSPHEEHARAVDVWPRGR